MRLLVYRVFLGPIGLCWNKRYFKRTFPLTLEIFLPLQGETDRQAEFDDLLACVNLRDTAVLALHRDA